MSLTVDSFPFQSGVCPVCPENGGELLPCCWAKMHSHCLQDWIWQGCSIECPCCKETLPQSLVQRGLVERLQRLPDMKAGFIKVSVFVSAGDFKPPYLETKKEHTPKKKHHSKLVSFKLPSLQGLKANRQQRVAAWESGDRAAIVRANRDFNEHLQLGALWLGIHFVEYLPYIMVE